MFVDFDFTRELSKPRLAIARPNKQVIFKISNESNVVLSLYDSELSQLSFNVPLMVENTSLAQFEFEEGVEKTVLVPNPAIDYLKEKMLVKVTIDNEDEWFIIDSAEETRDDDILQVSCFYLPYEMSHTNTGGDLEEETHELKEILELLLGETSWKMGTIDPTMPELYRNIGFSGKTTIIDAIFQVCETYNVYPRFDTNNREVHIESKEKHSIYRGLNIDYGRLLDSYVIKTTSDEIATILYVYGNEGLGISEVSPTGLPYLEDYSYFMFPFEYNDENQEVVKSSIYMTDELCIALHKYKKAQDTYKLEIIQTNEDIMNTTIKISTEESNLNVLKMELDGINDRLDTAKASEASDQLISQIQTELNNKTKEISQKEEEIKQYKETLEFKKQRLSKIQETIIQEGGFTEELNKELQLFRIEKDWVNEDYIDANELFEAGTRQFEKQKRVKAVIDISIVNLFNVIEEDFYRDKIKVGDIVRVSDYQRNVQYKAPIISVEYNFEDNEASIKIAEDGALLTDDGGLSQFINDAKETNSIVQENGKYWDNVKELNSVVSDIINGEWDANKNQISAGVNNEITMGKRGIMIVNPDKPDEVIIMQSGIIALSEDKGVTWKTAIKPTGIVAERLIGRVLVGEELMIANENNSFVLDENGAVFDAQYFKVISSDGNDLVSDWEYAKNMLDNMMQDSMVSPYEKKELRTEWAKIVQQFNGYTDKTQIYYPDPENLPEYVQYKEAYDDLYTYLFVTLHGDQTKPMLDPTNVETTTGIDRDEFTQKFSDINKYLSLLDSKLTSETKNQLDQNQKMLDEIKDQINDVMNDVTYKVRLTSTNGTIFKNNNIQTSLVAQLFKDAIDITANVPNTGFVWKKFDMNGVEDLEWNKNHINAGNIVEIGKEDVQEKSTFSVDFYYDGAGVRGEGVTI